MCENSRSPQTERAATMLAGRYQPLDGGLLRAANLTAESPEVTRLQAVLDRHHTRLGHA